MATKGHTYAGNLPYLAGGHCGNEALEFRGHKSLHYVRYCFVLNHQGRICEHFPANQNRVNCLVILSTYCCALKKPINVVAIQPKRV